MRAFTLLIICLALITVANCYGFTATGTVQVGSGAAWPATIKADTSSQQIQIDYTFGVRELELYPTHSRYQTCPAGGCKNYYLQNPMPAFEYRSNPSSDGSNNKYTTTSNGYTTTLWVDKSTGKLVKATQTGSGYSRTYTFTSITESTPTFVSKPQNCDSVQCGQALDLMLVIDSSGSISPNDYVTEMDYAQQVIDSFTIGQYGVHAGLVTFATSPLLRSQLTANKASLSSIISSAQQQGGETNIGGAIQSARSEFSLRARGGNVPKVIILLTDGKANKPDVNPGTYMIQQANQAKAEGIIIYAIGVGSQVQQQDLNDIASAPTSQYTSLVGNFDQLASTIAALINQVCVGGETDGCSGACAADTQFCGCGACVCAGSETTCGNRGSWNAAACSCNCESGWAQTTSGTNTRSCMKCTVTNCNGHGSVVSNANTGECGCDCENNYGGTNCASCTFGGCVAPEVAAGGCGQCKCPANTFFTYPGCTTCPANVCGHGRIVNPSTCNSCNCDANWSTDSQGKCTVCNWECAHGGNVVNCNSCSCNTPWDGPTCEQCVLTCQKGTLDSSNCVCRCNTKYSGTNCDRCDGGYCKHGGTQKAFPDCGCNCPTIWADGANCNICQISSCQNGGELRNTNGECECRCPSGFSGTYCETCSSSYCKHGGTNSYPTCAVCTGCDDYWTGSNCNSCRLNDNTAPVHCITGSKKDDCSGCECASNRKGPLCDQCVTGYCIHGVQKAAPDCGCICPDNFSGNRCNECSPTLCANGGTPTDNTCTKCNCDNNKNWEGDFCDECNIECVNGRLDEETCHCVCDDKWVGNLCDDCHNDDPTECFECSYNGVLNEDCTLCICDEFHDGETCEDCKIDCNGRGTPSEDCRTCSCEGGWLDASNCLVCDTTPNSVYCNNRGNITDPTTCNECDCINEWGNNDCSQCTINCNGNGRPNEDCTACVCDDYWNATDGCLTCALDCLSNGVPNPNCDRCICDDGYTGIQCDTCPPSYVNQCSHDTGTLAADCKCDCLDQWTGRLCNECDLTALNCVNGDIIDYPINGEMQCRCRCNDNWVGDSCDYCGFLLEDNSLYTCSGISEPVITDCSCHCPEYYLDIEGCDICVITNEDCAHEEPGSVPDLTKGVCACICEGNWSGRACDECVLTCETGWELIEEECECVPICGDGLIVGDEECEITLMNEKDQICCLECQFDDPRICDDQRSCSRYDFCEVHDTGIRCDGTDKIDYTVDADRKPIALGPLVGNHWTKWGVTVTYTGISGITIVDPRTTFGFPTSNPNGGNIVFDRVLVPSNNEASGNLCFNMDQPIEVQSVSIINNSKAPGSAATSFHIEFYCPTTINPIIIDARNYGSGSVEFIGNPCPGNLVTKICYKNFPNAAIGPVFFCDDNNHNLGRLGDYVWYDISVDNIQDANENPVPNVPVKLYDGPTGKYLAITYTDDSGLYIFEYLYNGNYSVEFNVPIGYTFSTPVRHAYPNIEHFGTLDNNLITNSVKEILTVDVGIYLFGTIGDYIFYDVNEDGIQNEAASYSVAGVTLRLYEADDLNTVLAERVTDAFGNYLFTLVPIYKTADTYHEYIVTMTPPTGSTVTYQFSGTDRVRDCNFARTAPYQSDIIYLTPSKTIDLTIDGGIYYCCGSVGDRVWYDDKTTNGIQDRDETGVSDVRVTLYHNGVAIGSQTTSSTGYYLFTGLQLSGSYYVHFDRVPNYVLTEKSKGTDRELDSDANPNGDTEIFYLTRDRPDRRDIDAGIKQGCITSSECTTDDKCKTATCENNQCQFINVVTCAALVNDPCNEPVCQPSTGQCVPIPRISSGTIPCNDNNVCTEGDICVGGQCKGTPSNGIGYTCNDNNSCTTADHCVVGQCVGTPCTENPDPCFTTICDGTGCKDVPVSGASCNDNNKCTENDVCDATGRCGGTPKACANNEYCKLFTCDPRDGRCKSELTPNAPCNDGDSCTEGDICDARGRCNGTPKSCTGTDQCTNYFCQAGECKTSAKSSSTPCNDNNSCTNGDHCYPDKSCAGTPINCNDGKVCTTDTCVNGVCQHNVPENASCTDNNLCTTERCDAITGACISDPIICNDNKICTNDVCVNGVCVYEPISDECNDSNPCTVMDVCDIEGNCSGVPKTCDDNNICTDDSCNPITGDCINTPNSIPCDDNTECSETSYCTLGECVGYDVVECTTANPCKTTVCEATTGNCIESDLPDNTVCETNDLCKLNGVCLSGACQGRETVCNDNNPCTVDTCEEGVCIYTPSAETDNVPCNDGNLCTENDRCLYDSGFNLSRCTGIAIECDDNNECTIDFCNISTGQCDIENHDQTVTCQDGVACTLNDRCVAGECTGTPRVCTPSGICKESICSTVTGECVETITENQTCNDSNPCTIEDVCDSGAECHGRNKCDALVSTNPCKDYICSTEGDCLLINLEDQTPCNDGNACTQSDVCILGRCTGTNPFPCESETCIDRVCAVDESGNAYCKETNNQNTCGIETECHRFICTEGTCTTHTSKDCNAANNNPCTRRVCDETEGVCKEENFNGVCEDGNPCTVNVCSNGQCIVDSTLIPCGETECTEEVPCPAAPNCFHNNCVNRKCVLTADSCETSNDPCVRNVCNRETDQCEPVKLINTVCNDENSCTENDICVSTGSGATDIDCRGRTKTCPSLLCKEGVCDATTGDCTYVVTEGASCDDGIACTEEDRCDANGRCRGDQITCDDGNVCTTERCENGVCTITNNEFSCSDNNLCTRDDRCFNGQCVPGAVSSCPESTNPCLRNVCHPTEGCVSEPIADDTICGSDNDGCTSGDFVCRGGVCIPPARTVCPTSTHPECPSICIDGSCRTQENSCNDQDACTVQDRCRANGECIGVVLDCSHLNTGCAVGVCYNGACVSKPIDTGICDDNDACTDNYCESGVCRSTPATCESDDNPCRKWTCDKDRGCISSNNPVSCTPTGLYDHCFDHICIDQVCTEVPPFRNCDDANPCTEDRCDPTTGACRNDNNDALTCSDNNPCTNDACVAGSCRSSEIVCNDGNVCTDDHCVGGICVTTANTNQCEYNVGCVIGGVCSNKQCLPSVVRDCPTDTQCTTSACDTARGICVVSSITDGITGCDDGNACTDNDVCSPTGCHGVARVCPSSTVECQEAYCAEGECRFRSNDNLQCHSEDTSCGVSICSNGVCIADKNHTRDCSDNDNCTYDNICTDAGCEFKAYSCILNPCVYSSCNNDGFCRFDNAVDSWNPLTFISFKSRDTQTASDKHYIVAVSSLTGDIRGFLPINTTVKALQAKPYAGGLYGVFNINQNDFYRIPVNTSAVNVLSTVQLLAANFAGNVQAPDLSFKPTFVSTTQPHTYTLWARARATGKIYSIADNYSSATNRFSLTGASGWTWDNHGRFIFGIVGNTLSYYDADGNYIDTLCNGDSIIPSGTVIDMFTRYDESIVGATDEPAAERIHIFAVRFDRDPSTGNAICITTNSSIAYSSFINPASVGTTLTITGIAFDDTLCAMVVPGPNSNGGNVTHTGGGYTPNNGGNTPPNPPNPPPPGDTITHHQGGSAPGGQAPGTTNNQVLSGGTGSIATAVVSVVGSSAVAAFAIFAVVLGLNNTKKDPPASLSAALVSTETSAIASDNPLFQGANEAIENVNHG